jgi:hypothetical protein
MTRDRELDQYILLLLLLFLSISHCCEVREMYSNRLGNTFKEVLARCLKKKKHAPPPKEIIADTHEEHALPW